MTAQWVAIAINPADMQPGDILKWRKFDDKWLVHRVVHDQATVDLVEPADTAENVRRLIDLEKFHIAEIARLRDQLTAVTQDRNDMAASATDAIQACERARESDIAELQAAAQGERARQRAAVHQIWIEIFGGSMPDLTAREQTFVRMLLEERAARRHDAQMRRFTEDRLARVTDH